MAEAWKSAPAVTEAPKAAWQSAPAVRRDSFGDGVEGVMDGLAEAIKAIPDALRHPLDSAYQMFEASKDQYEKAVKAAGPGRDNKGDVAGFIQHAVGMFPVLGPMASNLLDAVDSGTDSYEVGKRAGNLLSLKVVPEITKKGIALAGKAVDVAPSVGPALKAGVKAAGPDVAAGAAKAAGGMAVGELLPIPVVKHLVALEMSRPGLRQAGRGLVKGFNAARESFSPTTEAVSPQLDAFAVRAGFPDFASAPLEIKTLLQNAFEAEVDRLAQTPPKVDPGPAGVTPSGPVRPPVATAAQMMREAETFRPPETFVPGGPLRPPVRPAPASAATPAAAAAPAEMPALEQITEWLANRDGGTASRFTDPVVSEAPITKQTLGDIMDRLMKNRKVPAEVPVAAAPVEAALDRSKVPPIKNKVDLFPDPEQEGILDSDNVAQIKKAIEEGKNLPPIVARENGQIIEGHHRAEAYKQLGKRPEHITVSDAEFDRMRAEGMTRDEIEYEVQQEWRDAAKSAIEAQPKAPPIQNKVAAGKPVTAATLMEEVAKPDSFQELRDMIKERAGKKVPPFDWTDEAQYREYQKALVEDSNIYGNNRTTMADRVTRFMKKNGIEPTDSGIVRALNESAEDIAVSPTTGLKRPSFNAADHEVLFDMIKDRLETPTGGNPAASAEAKPAAALKGKAEIAARIGQIDTELSAGMEDAMRTNRPPSDYEKSLGIEKRKLQSEAAAMAKAEKPAASAAAKPPAKPRSKRITVGELMEKAKSAEPTIEAEAELVAPKIIDAPRSLSKLYGSNWMERADAAELKSAFNKATRARTKSLEAYRKYVEESNRRFYASKEYNSPEAAARRNEIAKDTNERLARIAEAKPSWRKK